MILIMRIQGRQQHRSLRAQRQHQFQQEQVMNLSRRNRSACRLFVWDAISALRFNLCNELLQDCVYEGLGGKKVYMNVQTYNCVF